MADRLVILGKSRWEIFLIRFFYFIILSSFFSFSSFLLFWIFLELNLVLYLLVISFRSSINGRNYYQLLFYFMIQSLGSIVFLTIVFISFFSFESHIQFLAVLSVILKIGVYPFYSWVLGISSWISSYLIGLLLRMQKIPLFFLMFNFNSHWLLILLCVNLIFGSLIILKSKFITSIIIFSSIYRTFWFFCCRILDYKAFIIFLIQYLFLVYWLLKENSLSPQRNIYLIFISMFLIGIPPLSFFFFKFYSIRLILLEFSYYLFFILWLSTFVSFVGYLTFFFKSFVVNFNLYKEINKSHLLIFLFGSRLFIFFF